MQYYVIAADGQKYGPADTATLATWAQEGRINPDTQLESMQDASRLPASSVPGVIAQAPPGQYVDPPSPQQFAQYPRTGMPASATNTQDITLAWVFGALGLASVCCCAIFGIAFGGLGVFFGNRAKNGGNPNGQAAMILSLVALALSVASLVLTGLLQFSPRWLGVPFGR